jgi:SAM-dependent methyltransferase
MAEASAALDYTQCSVCKLWRMTSQPDEAALAAAYSEAYYGSSRRKFIGPVASLVAIAQLARAKKVLQHLPQLGPKILDIGCGNGGFLAAAASLGAICEGTEFSSQSAERAAAIGVKVHSVAIEDLDRLETKIYDAITMWHVIEHLRDPEIAIRQAALLIKPGGVLFISAPNHLSYQARLFRERWFHLDPPRHLWGFSPVALTAMVERHGFAVTQVTTFSLEQNPYGILQSVLNVIGFPYNRAYDTLKGIGRPSISKIVDYACIAALAVPCIILSAVESAVSRGGTFCLVARRGE